MKINTRFLLFLALLLTFASCKKDKTIGFDIGKNRFTTVVDGDDREYYVHVPESYDPDVPIPVVFMLHGTSGDGLKFYNISGWKELGETENILTIFPSSWRYCIIEDGNTQNITKWNCFPGAFSFCSGETPRDDVKFLRQILTDLGEKFTLDDGQVYMVGFSNGGQMATRCSVEMSDVIAAVVESAGSFSSDTLVNPLNKIPVWYEIGNVDDRLLTDSTTNIPMRDFELFMNVSAYGSKVVSANINSFGCDSNYVLTGDSNVALLATYPGLTATPPHEFRFMLIKGLEHEYPNGTNHPFNGPVEHWAWFQQYRVH